MLRWVASVAMFAGFAYAAWQGADAIGRHRDPVVATECIGDPQAAHHAVYLHGIDSFGPSWQELDNRRTLARLADAKHLAIAIPRAPVMAGGRRWPQDTVSGLLETNNAIRDAARACFASTDHLGVIGFSNGGFAIARLYQKCIASFDWFIVSGAGGSFGAEGDDLSACGHLAVVVGARDRYHYEFAAQFNRDMLARHADVNLVEFDGGHRLDFDALMEAIQGFARAPER